MGVVLISGSSVSLTTGSETVLTNIGAPGRYQLIADLSNYQAGDTIELRVKAMATPTGTARVMEYMAYYGAQPADDIVKFSSVIPNDQTDGNALQFTANQSRGTSRALLWKVLQVDKEPANFLNFSIDAQGRVVSSAVQNGVVVVSGSVIASAVQGGFVTVTGTVNLTNNQVVNFSGTITNVGNVTNVVRANMIQIDNLATSGTNATLNLKKLNIFNSTPFDYALSVEGSNGAKIWGDFGAGMWLNSSGSSALQLDSDNYAVNAATQSKGSPAIAISGNGGGGVFVFENATGVAAVTYENDKGPALLFYGTGSVILINSADLGGGIGLSNPAGAVENNSGTMSLALRVGTVTGSVMSVISGTAASFDPSTVWSFTGTRSLNGIQNWNLSGTVGALATNLDKVNYQLAPNQVVIASAVQGGFVTVTGTVVVGTNNDKTGYSLSTPQSFNWIGNQSGSIVGNVLGTVNAVQGGYVTVSGAVVASVNGLVGVTGGVVDAVRGGLVTVSGAVALQPNQVVIASAVQGGFVTVSGTVIADVRSLVGVSGTVVVGTNNDKTGYSLSSPQTFNLIGNVSGTVVNNYLREQEIETLLGLYKEDERAVIGSIYYVDGLRGNDVSGDGTRLNPFKTITRALTPVVSHAHDAIILLPMPTGTNTITETGTVTITKSDVQIYGPGYDVLVTNIPANNRDVFNIQAEGVGLHQFRLTTAGNSSNGVTFSSGAALGLLSHIWIENVAQDGVFINVGNRNRILNSYIQGVGRDGVRINSGAGSGTYNRIVDSTIRNNAGQGINLLGTDASNTQILRNIIRDNIGFGVSISAGTLNTLLTDNRIVDNTAGPISDAGTNTDQQWNFFNTDTLGIPLAVYNVVSGTSINASQIWNYTGTRTVDYVRGLVGVSGTVVASAVQGGTVTVSGAVVADVRSLVGVSGTVVASAVQGGFVTVSGAVTLQPNQVVIASAVQGGYVTVSGAVVASSLQSLVGVTGGFVDGVRSLVGVSGTVNLTNNQVVNFSGTITNVFNVLNPVVADVRSLVGVSGTVVVGTNNDKTGYSLSSPQRFDLIGNITGSIQGNITTVITGAAANIDYSQVWSFTGSRSLNGLQQFNWIGNQTGSIVGNITTVITGAAASIDYSQIWNYTGTKIVDAVKGGYVNASGVSVNIDYSQIWNFTGTRTVNAVQGGYVTVSGTVIADVRSPVGISGTVLASAVQGGFVTVSGTVALQPNQVVIASVVQGGYVTVSGTVIADVRSLVGISGSVVVNQNLDKTGYSLSSPQSFNLIGNISGTITNVYNVISGTQASIDYSQVWSYTGSRSLNGLQQFNWIGNQTGSIVGNITTVITGAAASIDYSQVWAYTGTRSLNGQQYWNLSGSIYPGQAISLTVTGVTVDAASVWNYSTRTLTDQVFNLPPVEQGNNLNIRRGDTFIWAPTNLGSLANLSKLYFTVKRLYTDLDTESEIQVEKTGGLLYINRQAATVPLNGSIVVNDANLGNITITVAASETAKLDLLTDIYYDVQFINASGTVSTLVSGLVTIDGDATRGTAP